MTTQQKVKTLKLRLKELFWLRDYEPIEMFLAATTFAWGVWFLFEVEFYGWIVPHTPEEHLLAMYEAIGGVSILIGSIRIIAVLWWNVDVRRRLTTVSLFLWIYLVGLTIVFGAKLPLALFVLFATANLILYLRMKAP